jgi:signal transduction histidine kinase
MIFRRAKLRLALSYAVVQLLLFGAFGLGIYAYVTSAFDFDVAEGDSALLTAEEGFATLRNGILLAYAALVIVIPVTSYLLATLAMRPILASFEAQQRFVDDASHEFRTPLSALQAQLELGLRRKRTTAEYRTVLGHSLFAAEQLNEILNDLLVLSRGAHDASIAMHEVELGTVISDALAQLSPADSARVTRTDTATARVVAAPAMLARALINLLVNALRYSQAGSVVGISVSTRGGVARISVEDHGVGMTASQRRLAFDRFWRADPSRTGEGRGLGLSIVREIIQLHGGRIDLESEPGVGTTASVELPLSR